MSVFDSQGTTTVKRIPEGYYSLKSLGQAFEDTLKSATPSMCLEGRSEGVKVKMKSFGKNEEFWKSTILKRSISFLTMTWLIFSELNDVCKPST